MLKINSRIIIIRHEYYANKTLGWFWFSKGISAWKMCCACLARNSNIPICICWWNNLRDYRFHGKMCNSSSTRKIYFKLTYWQLLSFIRIIIMSSNILIHHLSTSSGFMRTQICFIVWFFSLIEKVVPFRLHDVFHVFGMQLSAFHSMAMIVLIDFYTKNANNQ